MIFEMVDSIDAPVAPALQVERITDRRRPGRVHDVSPALIPLLRNPGGVAVVDDIVAITEGNEVAPQGISRIAGSAGIWTWTSWEAGILTAAAFWFVTGHGSSIASALGNVLRFLYGIGLLM
jgi:hypothetical protein